MKPLTPRQQQFVAEYLIDLNASAAARRAGYKGDPNTIGPRLLANVGIRSQIEVAKAKRIERTQITADRVLQELARIAFFDIRRLYNVDGTMKKPSELDDEAAAVLAGVDVIEQATSEVDDDGNVKAAPTWTKKAKVFDKTAALTLAMRHLGMLKDKLEVEATINGLAERMRQQRGG